MNYAGSVVRFCISNQLQVILLLQGVIYGQDLDKITWLDPSWKRDWIVERLGENRGESGKD